MSAMTYLFTALSPSTSLREAAPIHWRESLMEASELGALRLSICLFATFAWIVASMVHRQHHPQKRHAVPGNLHTDTHQDEGDDAQNAVYRGR
jgi:hypothetical protein